MCEAPWSKPYAFTNDSNAECELWTASTISSSSFDILQIVHGAIAALLFVSSFIGLLRARRAVAQAKLRTAPSPVSQHHGNGNGMNANNTNGTNGIPSPNGHGHVAIGGHHVRQGSNGMRSLPSTKRRTLQLGLLLLASLCECIRAIDPFGGRAWLPPVVTLLAIDLGMASIYGIIVTVLLSWLDLTGPRSTSQLYTISSDVPSPEGSARRGMAGAHATGWVSNEHTPLNNNTNGNGALSPASGARALSVSRTPSRQRRCMRRFVTCSMIFVFITFIICAIGHAGTILPGASHIWEATGYLVTAAPLLVLLILLLRATQRFHLLPQGVVSPAGGTSVRVPQSKQQSDSSSKSKLNSVRDEARSRPTTAEPHNNTNNNTSVPPTPHAPVLAGDCCSAMRPLLLALHLTLGIAIQVTLALIAIQRDAPNGAPTSIEDVIALMPCDFFVLISCILMMTPLPYLRVILLVTPHHTIPVQPEVIIENATPQIGTRGHKDSMTLTASAQSPAIHGYHRLDGSINLHGSMVSSLQADNMSGGGERNGEGKAIGSGRMEPSPPPTMTHAGQQPSHSGHGHNGHAPPPSSASSSNRSPRLAGLKGIDSMMPGGTALTMSPRILSSGSLGTTPRASMTTLGLPRPINPQLGLVDDPADIDGSNVVQAIPRRSLTHAPSVPHTTSGGSGGNTARASHPVSPTEGDAEVMAATHTSHGAKSLFAPPSHAHKGSFGMERTVGGWSPIKQRNDSSFVGGSLRVSMTESQDFDLSAKPASPKSSAVMMVAMQLQQTTIINITPSHANNNNNNGTLVNNGNMSSRQGTPRRTPSSHGHTMHTRSNSVTMAQPFTTSAGLGLGANNPGGNSNGVTSIAGSGPQVVRRGSSSRLVTAQSFSSPHSQNTTIQTTPPPQPATIAAVNVMSHGALAMHHSLAMDGSDSSSAMASTSMGAMIMNNSHHANSHTVAPNHLGHHGQNMSMAASAAVAAASASHVHHLPMSESSPPLMRGSSGTTTLSIHLPSPPQTGPSSTTGSPSFNASSGLPPLPNETIPFTLTHSAPPQLLRVGSGHNQSASMGSLSPLRGHSPNGAPNLGRRPSVTVRSPIQPHPPPMSSLTRPQLPNDLISPGPSPGPDTRGLHLTIPSPIPSPPQSGSRQHHHQFPPGSASASPMQTERHLDGSISPSASAVGVTTGPSPTSASRDIYAPTGPSSVSPNPPASSPPVGGAADRLGQETNKMMKLFPGLSPQWAGLLTSLKLERGGSGNSTPTAASTAGLAPFGATTGTGGGHRASRATMIRPLSQAETARLLAHKNATTHVVSANGSGNGNGNNNATSPLPSATGEGKGMLAHLKRLIHSTPEKDSLTVRNRRTHKRCYTDSYHFPVRHHNRRHSWPRCSHNRDDTRVIPAGTVPSSALPTVRTSRTGAGASQQEKGSLSPSVSMSMPSQMETRRGAQTHRGVSFKDHGPLSPIDQYGEEKKAAAIAKLKFSFKRPAVISTNNSNATGAPGTPTMTSAAAAVGGMAPLSLSNLAVPNAHPHASGSVSDRPASAGGVRPHTHHVQFPSQSGPFSAGTPTVGPSRGVDREPKSARGSIVVDGRLSIAANNGPASNSNLNKGFWSRVKNKLNGSANVSSPKSATPDSPQLTGSSGPRVAGHSRRQSSLGDIRALCKAAGIDETVELERLISDPIGLDFFTRYLRTEYSEENIEFWLHVNDHVKLTDLSQQLQKAKHIASTYVGSKAARQVNLSTTTQQSITNAMRSGNMELITPAFVHAQQELVKLMQTDSFRRFTKHALWLQMLRKMAAHATSATAVAAAGGSAQHGHGPMQRHQTAAPSTMPEEKKENHLVVFKVQEHVTFGRNNDKMLLLDPGARLLTIMHNRGHADAACSSIEYVLTHHLVVSVDTRGKTEAEMSFYIDPNHQHDTPDHSVSRAPTDSNKQTPQPSSLDNSSNGVITSTNSDGTKREHKEWRLVFRNHCDRDRFHLLMNLHLVAKVRQPGFVYIPEPLVVTADLLEIANNSYPIEKLAQELHLTWAATRQSKGWTWGEELNDMKKTHPSLVPFKDLSETERKLDCDIARLTVASILHLGYDIVRNTRGDHESKGSMHDELTQLVELLSQNAHDTWAEEKMKQGWRYGPTRDDRMKTHPNIQPYSDMSNSEQDMDRHAANTCLSSLLKWGYSLNKREDY